MKALLLETPVPVKSLTKMKEEKKRGRCKTKKRETKKEKTGAG